MNRLFENWLTRGARWAVLLFLLLTAATPAHAWWDKEWTIRKKITVDTSGIAEPIGNAAVLVRLHDGTYQFGNAKDDGSDIRFVAADDKTLLPYHIEKFDGLLNEAFVWVKVSGLAPGAKTDIWLYYGNTGPKAVKAEDAKGTFDADTVLVYHFGDKNAPPADLSGNSNSGKNAVPAVEGALIGGGARFDGKTFVTTESSPSLTWAEGEKLTWSAWVKPTALAPGMVLFSRKDGARGLVVGLDNGAPYVEVSGQRSPSAPALAVNAWRHLAVVADGAKVTLYVDGDAAATLAASIPALATALQIGGAEDATASFSGEMDEMEISKVARPVGFLKLVAQVQGAPEKAGKVLVMAPDEESGGGGGGHTGYFGVIVASLTVDGWVVIGILGVMFAISWWVMITKIGYLNSLAKGNEIFMREWEHVATDLTALDHGDPDKVKTLAGRATTKKIQRDLGRSSVYRLYRIGAEEIRHRMTRTHGERVLASRSIEAIRVTLDGAQVREKQRIDKLIVLLTICISGGPFLGLLGTVVGVMITFAAVAAAGDVNVNAIAPGIAAALLATVAGLAVAIPALFGYNYILARVKDATADMHVFADEFVAKMAEFYSESSSSTKAYQPVRQTTPEELEFV